MKLLFTKSLCENKTPGDDWYRSFPNFFSDFIWLCMISVIDSNDSHATESAVSPLTGSYFSIFHLDQSNIYVFVQQQHVNKSIHYFVHFLKYISSWLILTSIWHDPEKNEWDSLNSFFFYINDAPRRLLFYSFFFIHDFFLIQIHFFIDKLRKVNLICHRLHTCVIQ